MLKDIEKKKESVIENLRKNHFKVIPVDNVELAKEEMLKLISEDEVVGVGGSLSVRETGVIEELLNRGNKVIHHWLPGTFIDEIRDARRRAVRLSDTYLTSTNAITLEGYLVNMDTFGNRVSAMIYGPKKVIIVAGWNKVVKNTDEAFKRIREDVAVRNAQRLNMDNPNKLCKVSAVMYERPDDTDITIILINGEIGY
ncbi:MAG TPA: lactate utilization protein [Candidatus Goldiibacteriota bacterium]|nr:lactate utilization protein [Candidatus Goldiibacteriota bacterium]HPI03769.1 lactate utilization protein [Candidatus Goldiibacteriota bacterium]HPN64656.1 lactate utilization protein [Candidatus Goldiibacteriota bacterium]HRQ44006.1 lactate utilization protein [Candidatus Goldiibacteriota bacterium]